MGDAALRLKGSVGDSAEAGGPAYVHCPAMALDRRAYVRLARTLQASVEGLRGTAADWRELDSSSDDKPDAPSARTFIASCLFLSDGHQFDERLL